MWGHMRRGCAIGGLCQQQAHVSGRGIYLIVNPSAPGRNMDALIIKSESMPANALDRYRSQGNLSRDRLNNVRARSRTRDKRRVFA